MNVYLNELVFFPSMNILDEYFLRNVHAIETVTQTWIQAIHSTMIKNSMTELSTVDNIHAMIKKYPSIDVCPVDEMSINNIQPRCVECGFKKAFVQKEQSFVEISLSGTEYNSQTLKIVDNERIFSKVNTIFNLFRFTDPM